MLTWTVPLGGLAASGIVFLVNLKGQLREFNGSIVHKIRLFDPLGNLTFIGSVLSLLFAMHWGGDAYPFNAPRIIVLFTLFGAFLVAFVLIEVLQSDEHSIGK